MAMMWDLYKRFGNTLEFVKTSQTIERGKRLPDGTFHQVVHVWIKNEIGSILFPREAQKKVILYAGDP